MQIIGSARNEQHGFTLVELLIVMLLLAILVALIVPSFFSQSEKAHDAQAQSAARVGVTAVESWAIDNGGRYAGVDAAAIMAIEPTLSGANLSLHSVGARRYTVRTISSNAHQFEISRQPDGELSRSCFPAGAGGCRADGSWG